jgi:hypothetical protein
MSTNLIEQFKYLPDELIHHIINYTDAIVYRNGKYMNRIKKDDIRSKMIEQIPRPYILRNGAYISIRHNNKYKCILRYLILNYTIELYITFFGHLYGIHSKSYVFSKDSCWFNKIEYSM